MKPRRYRCVYVKLNAFYINRRTAPWTFGHFSSFESRNVNFGLVCSLVFRVFNRGASFDTPRLAGDASVSTIQNVIRTAPLARHHFLGRLELSPVFFFAHTFLQRTEANS